MKKIVGLLLILVLAAAVLAGCGGPSRKELLKGTWMTTYGWSHELREDGVMTDINVYGDVMRENKKWDENSVDDYKVVSVNEDTLVLEDDNGSQETWTRVK